MRKIYLQEMMFHKATKALRAVSSGKAILPPVIYWDITFACNLRCRMCPYYGEGATPPKLEEELPLERIKEFISEMAKDYKFYKPMFIISGGEPFLKKGIYDILEHIRKNGMKFCLVTNFTTDMDFGRLVKIGPSNIFISIDGPEAIHDYVRGVEGAFKRTTDNIRKFKETPGSEKIPVSIDFAIMKDNYQYIEDLFNIAKDLGVDMRYIHVMMLDKNHIDSNKMITKNIYGEELEPWFYTSFENQNFDEQAVNTIIEKINKIKKEAKNIGKTLTFQPDIDDAKLRKFYLDPNDKTLLSNQCSYVWGAVRINSHGDVYPCMKYIYGNLKTQRFSEVVNNEKAIKFRKELKKFKLFPGCIRCCKLA